VLIFDFTSAGFLTIHLAYLYLIGHLFNEASPPVLFLIALSTLIMLDFLFTSAYYRPGDSISYRYTIVIRIITIIIEFLPFCFGFE
jgi:hypothetical protein